VDKATHGSNGKKSPSRAFATGGKALPIYSRLLRKGYVLYKLNDQVVEVVELPTKILGKNIKCEVYMIVKP